MPKVRISTTVDADLLAEAKRLVEPRNDAVLMEEALTLLVEHYQRIEIDASYAVYDEIPLDTPDEWGNLAEWLDAARKA